MQLPSFITRALAFFTTAEAFHAKVEAALGTASTAQAEVVRLTGELAARDVTIASNASALADFEGRVSAAVLTANATAKASQDAAEAVAAKAVADLAAISGQKPIETKSRKSIATFKLRDGMTIGLSDLSGEGGQSQSGADVDCLDLDVELSCFTPELHIVVVVREWDRDHG